MEGVLTVRARWIIIRPGLILSDGGLILQDGQVQQWGLWKDLRLQVSPPIRDLGNVIVFPAWINCHTHLEYSHFSGWASPRPTSFVHWIEQIIRFKTQSSPQQFRQSWEQGMQALLRQGVGTVFDHVSSPEAFAYAMQGHPIRRVLFREILCPQAGEREKEARRILQEVQQVRGKSRWEIGLAPHAPYSVIPRFLRQCVLLAVRDSRPLSIHVAESKEEWEMFVEGKGRLREWLEGRGFPVGEIPRTSPVGWLIKQGMKGAGVLLIHGNYMTQEEMAFLGQNKIPVVHCPGSHAFFGHRPFPYSSLRRYGVEVFLGVDSPASVEAGPSGALNVWEEARRFLRSFPGVSEWEVFAMMTAEPGRWLRRFGWKVGTLEKGAEADFAVVSYEGKEKVLLESLLWQRSRVDGLMIQGQWVIPPGAEEL